MEGVIYRERSGVCRGDPLKSLAKYWYMHAWEETMRDRKKYHHKGLGRTISGAHRGLGINYVPTSQSEHSL